MKIYLIPVIFIATVFFTEISKAQTLSVTNDRPVVSKNIILDANKQYQTIDGFGVNVTPAQWRNGNLKPALDSLVDDLGCTLIRFDCYGLANWLDPAQQKADGSFTNEYLEKVYKSKVFEDAWATFRYLNSKGVEPIFNISGSVPSAWTVAIKNKHDRLQKFDAYAAMAVSMLVWAREKEGLKFSYFMPFNETDLGFPEGPRLLDEDCIPAVKAILKKLKENNMEDIKCIVMDDANISLDRIKQLTTLSEASKIKGIGEHTYGNGAEEDNRGGWYNQDSQFAKAKELLQSGSFKDKSFLLTEYGDLDQSGEIEFEVGWRSTRRLLKCLNDGVSGGIAWDAYDNFHVHDNTWALYGLLKTDTVNWTYTAKPRYYAAKQIYKYILPGYKRIEILAPEAHPDYVFREWKNTLRNMLLSAYLSPDGKNFTLTGMNSVEGDVELNISLQNFNESIEGKFVNCYITSSNEHFKKIMQLKISEKSLKIIVPAHAIFTVSTLD